MTIDFNLIKTATDYSLDKLNCITSTSCPYVFLLEDFLDQTLLGKLNSYIVTLDEKAWTPSMRKGRVEIAWIPDSVIEEVHVVFDNMTNFLNQKFNKRNKFLGINIWKDRRAYQIGPHADNPAIDLSIQIYLNSCEVNLVTEFLWKNKIRPTYKPNNGYLMDNTGQVLHQMNTPIPENFVRYSLYATWVNS